MNEIDPCLLLPLCVLYGIQNQNFLQRWWWRARKIIKSKNKKKKEEVWYDERGESGKSSGHRFDNTQNVGPISWVKLQKCHHNSIFITQKHHFFFSFSLTHKLNLVSFGWWKQKMKTHPNKCSMCGTHQFWVMSLEWWVMENTKSKHPLRLCSCLLIY